jgi:hypothetical protein
MRIPVLAALAAVLILAGCGGDPGGHQASTASSPLGGDWLTGQLCWPSRPGQIIYYGGIAPTNKSEHPVTITGAWLTGTRELSPDGAYAFGVVTGSLPISVIGPGWPAKRWAPASYERPADGTVIRPGATAQIVVLVKVHGRNAFANGLDLTYTSQGQSWIQKDPHLLRLGHYCPEPG